MSDPRSTLTDGWITDLDSRLAVRSERSDREREFDKACAQRADDAVAASSMRQAEFIARLVTGGLE